jgi:F0F1-type ATP synthase membrane subunit a
MCQDLAQPSIVSIILLFIISLLEFQVQLIRFSLRLLTNLLADYFVNQDLAVSSIECHGQVQNNFY